MMKRNFLGTELSKTYTFPNAGDSMIHTYLIQFVMKNNQQEQSQHVVY
jgi:hypothetical protein